MREPKAGEAVIYVDPVGVAHAAIVTQPWSSTCVNLVYVTSDEARKDSYGRQIERQSSLMHASVVPVHGNYWRFADEQAKDTERAA